MSVGGKFLIVCVTIENKESATSRTNKGGPLFTSVRPEQRGPRWAKRGRWVNSQRPSGAYLKGKYVSTKTR